MQPVHIHATNTLLTYSLVTSPTPVQVSPSTTTPAQTPSVASLTFVVSCPQSVKMVTVSQIIIVLPVDIKDKPPDPVKLAATAPPLSSASISSSGTDVWVPAAGAAPGVFIFTPKSGQPVQVSQQSLTIQFNGIQVNTLVGTALVTVNEWAAAGSNPPPPVSGPPSGTIQFAVAKFPYGFYAGNFTSDKPMVQNGEKPSLTWIGSVNATYLMLYDAITPIDVSTFRTWSPPQPLTKTTTFILRVTAQQGGQTASLDFSITIEVSNPSLTAKDLTVLTNANLNGPVSVGTGSALADLTLNGNLKATKNASVVGSLNAANASVTGTLNAANASVTGTLNAANASVTGTLNTAGFNASGAAKLTGAVEVTGAATFAGGLTASGPLAAAGTVSLLGPTQGLSSSGNATTDGLIIGTVNAPFDGSSSSNATIYGATSNIKAQATGGGVVSSIRASGSYGSALSGMFVLPVRKGARWVCGITPPPGTTTLPDHAFYWIPLGAGAASLSKEAPAPEVDSDALPPATAEALPALPFPRSGQARLTDGRVIVQFLDDALASTNGAADEQSYFVLLTPTEQCAGLAVTQKNRDSFVVEELAHGKSDAAFDWFILQHPA
jgi:hypothetical protein